jgi:transposase
MDNPPETPQRKHLTRDERSQIRTLYFEAKWTQKAIATHLGVSLGQVQYTYSQPCITPRRRTGRPAKLSESDVEKLITFIRSSKEARQMPWSDLPDAVGLDCSESAIRTALRKAGFRRYIARRKPHTEEAVRITRKASADEA